MSIIPKKALWSTIAALVSVTALVAALSLDSPDSPIRGETSAVLMAVAIISYVAGLVLLPPMSVP